MTRKQYQVVHGSITNLQSVLNAPPQGYALSHLSISGQQAAFTVVWEMEVLEMEEEPSFYYPLPGDGITTAL